MATNEIELVEAAARALYRQSCILHGCGSLRFENLSPEGKTAWLDQARAVIPIVLERAAGVADRLGKERGAAADKAEDYAVYLVEVERENQSRCIVTAILSMKDEGR
jgi:hypothetical protein